KLVAPSLGGVNGDLNERQRRIRARLGRSIADLTGGMVRGIGAPTQLIALPGSDDHMTQRHARSVIDLCLRAGEAMLATGASSADTVATLLRISSAYGIRNMHVDITFTSIAVS